MLIEAYPVRNVVGMKPLIAVVLIIAVAVQILLPMKRKQGMILLNFFNQLSIELTSLYVLNYIRLDGHRNAWNESQLGTNYSGRETRMHRQIVDWRWIVSWKETVW